MKLKVSPKPGKYFESEEVIAGVQAIRQAVIDQDIFLLEGPVGSGKSIIYEVAKTHLGSQSGSFRVVELVPHQNLKLSSIARIMLHALGLPGRRSAQDCVYDLRAGLLNLQDAGITTALFFDHCELLPPSVWSALKFFNELRAKGDEVGTAIIATGDVNRKKIPVSIQARAEFFRLSGLGLEERKDFITYLCHRLSLSLSHDKSEVAVKNCTTPFNFVRFLKHELNEARRLRKPIKKIEKVVKLEGVKV